VVKTGLSVLTRLELSYSAGVPRSAPERVILKTPRPDGAAQASKLTEQEVEFYRVIAPQTPSPPTVRCHDAVFSPARGHGHLLLGRFDGNTFPPDLAPAALGILLRASR
jgi:hypothetical protein